jgi:isopentenyl diphosphate isomerase/L-lactate dehydrogenase-like FMN-dependent dehydrogenase
MLYRILSWLFIVRLAEVCLARSSLGSNSPLASEDIRAATRRPFWFQLYVLRDRGFSQSMIERARAAHCPVLVVTVDVPLRGQRHSDIRNGLTVPLRLTLRNMWDVATRPGWALDVLMSKRKTFGNIEAYLNKGRVSMMCAGEWSTQHFDQTLNWCDMEWLRSLWPGKLVIKGILDVEDAHRAVSVGADAIVVSNHGGRQLDGAPASIAVLPEISRAVGDRIEVLFDGGIRSGQDVMKALALGARAAAESGAARPDRQNLRQHVNELGARQLATEDHFPVARRRMKLGGSPIGNCVRPGIRVTFPKAFRERYSPFIDLTPCVPTRRVGGVVLARTATAPHARRGPPCCR